jgi:hypothetical protein
MVFITAGMGGGTGTGAAPVVAQLAKEMGILTVAVVTKPFPFEGRRRMQVALKGIEELSHHCDSLITIPNEKLITVLGRNATMIQAFRAANDVLLGAVQGIADLIVRPGLINVDFADVRTVMSEMGMAMMGTGVARGDDRARRRPKPRSATRCWTTSTFRAPTASWSTSPPAPTSPWPSSTKSAAPIEEFRFGRRDRRHRHRARPGHAGRGAGHGGGHRPQPQCGAPAGAAARARSGAAAGQAGAQRHYRPGRLWGNAERCGPGGQQPGTSQGRSRGGRGLDGLPRHSCLPAPPGRLIALRPSGAPTRPGAPETCRNPACRRAVASTAKPAAPRRN